MTENEIGTVIVDVAIAVHRELGPGLLESVYEVVFAYELERRGFSVKRQVPIAIHYKGMIFDVAFRADIVVEEKIVIEMKSVEQVSQAHKKQVQTYLRLTDCKLGFLLNFGEALMKRGITRVVNGLED
jgi:GxxExxY protein